MTLPARQSVDDPPFFCKAVACLLIRVNDDEDATSIQIHALVLGPAYDDLSRTTGGVEDLPRANREKITSCNQAHWELRPVAMDGVFRGKCLTAKYVAARFL
jgi:hypothetical protein